MESTNRIKTVTRIEATAILPSAGGTQQRRKKRVSAYARVSTDEAEQLTSYEAQVDFYTRHIQSNPEWEFGKVYTDEGITGTNTKKRDGFNEMVADALDGKIDLILTKSCSRFARNTVDSLVTVRKLKEKGVEVYFEKENIYTLDSKGELYLTIMSSLAQEESRSISESVTWGVRRRMEAGKVCIGYKHFLGYEKGADGLPKIVEAEAKIVRQIYAMFLVEGQTCRSIAQALTDQGIPTPSGKEKWCVTTVMNILRNEKYKGDALLQKTYTADFLSKKVKRNKGELTQYHIKNSHPAIISPETFDLVQGELQRRASLQRQIKNNSPFAAKVICGDCGGYYGSKVWHSTSKYRNVSWRCNRKYADATPCSTPLVREEELKAAFVTAFNRILGDKRQHIAAFEEMLPLLADTTALAKKLAEAQDTCDTISGRMRRCVEENARQIQDQEQYSRQFREMDAEYEAAKKSVEDIKEQLLQQSLRKDKIRRYLDELLKAGDIVTEFDAGIWQATVETVTVRPNKTYVFMFRDGTEISVKPQGGKCRAGASGANGCIRSKNLHDLPREPRSGAKSE